MAGTKALDRVKNFTRITTENIIQPDQSSRSARQSSSGETTPLTAAAPTLRGSRETIASTGTTPEIQSSHSTSQPVILQERRRSADISPENILDSPSAPRRTRRGAAIYVPAMRARSRRQEQRHNPITRKGRSAFKRSADTGRQKRVRLDVSLSPKEARGLLEQARQTDGENAPIDVPQGNEDASIDHASELGEDDTTPQTTSTDQGPTQPDDYALYEEAEAAVNESLNPRYTAIQRLATRAASSPVLRALMIIVASGNASPEQLHIFQAQMEAIEVSNPAVRNSRDSTMEHPASDSSSEPESDTSDKENVRPTSPQATGEGDSPGSPNNDEDSPTRGRTQSRQPLGHLPTPTVPPIDRSSQPSQPSSHPRVRALAGTSGGPFGPANLRPSLSVNSGRAGGQRNHTASSMNVNLEGSVPRSRLSSARNFTPVPMLGAIADYLPSPTPRRRSPLGGSVPLDGSEISLPLTETGDGPEVGVQRPTDDERSSQESLSPSAGDGIS